MWLASEENPEESMFFKVHKPKSKLNSHRIQDKNPEINCISVFQHWISRHRYKYNCTHTYGRSEMLCVNWTQHVVDLYYKNYRTLMKEKTDKNAMSWA